jgi:hypothetical protein
MIISLHSSGELENQEDRPAEHRCDTHTPTNRSFGSACCGLDHCLERKKKKITGAPFCGGSGWDAGVTRGRWPIMF